MPDLYEEQYRKAMLGLEQDGSARKSAVVYTIPVVIHIIHDGDPIGSEDNPTNADLADILNEASQRFRHTHPGAETYPDNMNYGIDTEIEFCLATTDPDGNYASGIVRHYDPANSFGSYNDLCSALTPYLWDPLRYCNLFIVNGMTDASGVSCGDKTIYSGGSAFWSGLIAHEVGHYFSLLHTFGNNNGCPANTDCLSDGDRVCDTPPKGFAGIQAGNCDAPGNTCTTDEADLSANNPYRPVAQGGMGDQADMLANYLDYTGSCWDAFTMGQKNRMRFNIENSRTALVISAATACAPQTTPATDIAVLEVIANNSACSGTFTPSVRIVNQGTAAITSLVLHAYVDEVEQLSEPWTGNLAPGAQQTILLTSSINITPGTHVLSVAAEQPNGGVDAYGNDNVGYAPVYYGGGGSTLPFMEDFAACQLPTGFVNAGWEFNTFTNPSGCQGCTLYALAFNNDPVTLSLTLPLLDLSEAEQAGLTFKLGHIPRYDFIPNDELRVEVSVNCGPPTIVYQKSGLDKATNDPPAYSEGVYLIPACDEFRTENIDLSAFAGMDQVQITFVAHGEWWSPLLIDDIHVSAEDADCDNPPPASGTIAGGSYSGVDLSSAGTVAAPSDVVFTASNSITLTDGFTVQSGAAFHALIAECEVTAQSEAEASAIPLLREMETGLSVADLPLKIAPNPFSGETFIGFELPEETVVNLRVFDAWGRQISSLLRDQQYAAGKHQIAFDGNDQKPGIYIVVLQTPDVLSSGRIVLAR